MSFLTAFFYDRFMAKAEEACLKDWRKVLITRVSGEVLEIGAGTGANLEFYPNSVTRLVLTEPDKHMRKLLQVNVSNRDLAEVYVSGGTAEQIQAGDGSFDFVVTSLVCCSLASLEAGLVEIRRVLRPGGSLVFLEHVAAANGTSRRRWQNRINPFWRTFMGNCHLNRETEQAILRAGFRMKEIQRESMRKAIPVVRPTIRGIAIKA
jgi:ubiquinone/menaquinone biosynthesis C-methylase UbiE